MSFNFEPIGVVRSPFVSRVEAPRQATAASARGVRGRIELLAGRGYEHALEDLASWERIWVLFVFDRNVREDGTAPFRSKVLPPRSNGIRRGLFATRSPHRPNPIGMSAVRLLGVSGLVVTVEDLDLLDGTPVLDLKPYVAYADAFPEAGGGWLETHDPRPSHPVTWSDDASAQLVWLEAHGTQLRERVETALALGPQPNAYRRIRPAPDGTGSVLSAKAWRIDFVVDGPTLRITAIRSGYRPSQLHAPPATTDPPDLATHRLFVTWTSQGGARGGTPRTFP